MQDQRPTSARGQDTISFYDLWSILASRKRWVLSTLFVAIVAALVYLALAPRVYEARVTLRIGQIAGAEESGSTLLEAPAVLASRMNASFGKEIADGVTRQRPFLRRSVALSSVPAGVELVAEGDSPEQAAEFLTRIFGIIQAAHNRLYSESHGVLADQLRNIDLRKAELQTQYQAAAAVVGALKGTGDAVQASVVVLEQGRIAAMMAELDADRVTAALRLAPHHTRPTVLLGEIVPPSRPSAPRRSLVVAIAVFTGLLGGVGLALLAEFRTAARRQAQ